MNAIMKLEIESAANFITHLANIARNDDDIDGYKLHKFNLKLQDVMTEKYSKTWNEDDPWYGSGRRIIRTLDEKSELARGHSVILEAALQSKICPDEIYSRMPFELTIWINPGLVTYRIFDFYFDLYDGSKDEKSWTPKTPIYRSPNDKEDFDYSVYENSIRTNDENNYDCI